MSRQVVVLALASAAAGPWSRAPVLADGPDPARTERLRFDPNQGQWVEQPAPEPGTPQGELAAARADFSRGEFGRAHRRIAAWQKGYGESSELHPEALLLEAQIEKARRNYHEAYVLLTRFLDLYRPTALADQAVVELFNIAEVYLSGVKRKFWGMRILSAEELALEVLDRISTEFEGTSSAVLALKTKGDYFFNRGDFLLAELEYGRIVQEYPAGRYHRYAMRQAAAAALAGFPGVRFDDAPLIEADERYRRYAQVYPEYARREGVGLVLEGIRERRADKEYEIAEYYQRIGQSRAARFYYEAILDHWPDTAAGAKAGAQLFVEVTHESSDLGPATGQRPTETPEPQSPEGTRE